MILELQSVEASYGGIRALRGVDIGVRAGSITCLVGPNGAGKTTTMSVTMGLVRPRAGQVKFAGQDITGRETSTIVKCGMTLVPENRLVFGNMTVDENLLCGAFQRKDRGVTGDIESMYQRFPNLAARRHQSASSLSGGEQQMLAIARALMSRPRLLLMDEPTLGLAPLVIAQIFEAIRHLRNEGVTLLIVEQNVSAAANIADYFYVLERGSIAFKGTPRELENNDVVARAYLGVH